MIEKLRILTSVCKDPDNDCDTDTAFSIIAFMPELLDVVEAARAYYNYQHWRGNATTQNKLAEALAALDKKLEGL